MAEHREREQEMILKSPIAVEKTPHQILNEGLGLVRAGSGSLMLLEDDLLKIEARLGPPHPERQADPVFKVGETSIAGWVAKTGQAYRCKDVTQDPYFAPSRHRHFRSLLAVPIISGDVVIGVLNADNEQPDFFTREDEHKLAQFAKHVAAPALAERLRRRRALDSLHQVGAVLTRLSPHGRLADVLKQIAEQAVSVLNIDLVTLYQYEQEKGDFLVAGTGPTIAGKLLWYDQRVMERRVYPGDIPWKIVQKGQSYFSADAAHDKFLIGTGTRPARDDLPQRPCFVHREQIKSVAALVLRIGTEIVGVMFANYREPHCFSEDEVRILETFGNYAAIAIKNARLQERLRAEEAWATLGKAAANLAHRINNTIGVIPVNVQELRRLLSEEKLSDRDIRNSLERIQRNAEHALEMARRLLQPFQLSETRHFNVNDLLAQALAEAEIPPHIKVIPQYASSLPPIQTSRQLQIAFGELISNAVKAMPNGGKLEVGSKAVPPNWVEVWIADTGHGIPEELRPKLFGMFAASDIGGYRAGLGLGLWWVRTFIEREGGTINVRSQIDQGTKFTIRLPIKEQGKERIWTSVEES